MKIGFAFSIAIGIAVFCLISPVCAQSTNTYDANGNLTSGDDKYLEYYQANKLVRVRQGSASGPLIAEYVYSP